MRHLGSLVLSLIAGALIYVLLGVAYAKWGEALGESGGSKYGAFAVSIGAALVAGGLYTILVLARLSPLGLVLLGLLYYVVAFWVFISPSSFGDLMPHNIAGVEGAGIAAAGPDLLLIGTPLLVTIFSPRRWRRWGNAPAAVAPGPGYSPPPVAPGGYQAPPPAGGGFGAPNYGSPSPSYAAPAGSAPNYAAPTSSAPNYAAPASSAPNYAAPASSAPNYAPPSSGAPTYASPTSGSPYSAPPYSPVSPAYGSPEPAGSYATSQPPYSAQPPGPEAGLPPLPLPPPEDPEATRRL